MLGFHHYQPKTRLRLYRNYARCLAGRQIPAPEINLTALFGADALFSVGAFRLLAALDQFLFCRAQIPNGLLVEFHLPYLNSATACRFLGFVYHDQSP